MESHLSFSCFVESRVAWRGGGGHVVGDGGSATSSYVRRGAAQLNGCCGVTTKMAHS